MELAKAVKVQVQAQVQAQVQVQVHGGNGDTPSHSALRWVVPLLPPVMLLSHHEYLLFRRVRSFRAMMGVSTCYMHTTETAAGGGVFLSPRSELSWGRIVPSADSNDLRQKCVYAYRISISIY
jgi:hypothetical protein